MSTLFENLGGKDAVEAVVETFYRHVLGDERISHFFEDTDMDKQIAKQKAFLTMAFGGPAHYSGQDMRRAHAHLWSQGLSGDHFDVVVELLGRSLGEHGVKDEFIAQVAGIAESARDDVLGR